MCWHTGLCSDHQCNTQVIATVVVGAKGAACSQRVSCGAYSQHTVDAWQPGPQYARLSSHNICGARTAHASGVATLLLQCCSCQLVQKLQQPARATPVAMLALQHLYVLIHAVLFLFLTHSHTRPTSQHARQSILPLVLVQQPSVTYSPNQHVCTFHIIIIGFQ